MQPVLIRHATAINCLGSGLDAIGAALTANRSGLRRCDFETVNLDTYIGRIDGIEETRIREDLASYDCRNNRLAQMALRQDGFEQAVAVAREHYGAARIGVFMGTSTSGIHETELAYRKRDLQAGAIPTDFRYAETQSVYSLADFVRRYLGLYGPSLVVSSACSSTAKVFADAARMITAGICDAAVVGGVDTLCLTTLYGFHSLELTSDAPCRPYDLDRKGISIGEGAGFALLEKSQDVVDSFTCRLIGVGESCDAYHMSTPHPGGLGAKLAMARALQSAGLSPDQIDYVNLHGTGTRTNDASEDKAVAELLGTETLCSSTKGATGHLLGAAGVTELLVSMIAMQLGFVPGSANTRHVDPALQCNYQLSSRVERPRRILTNSFGFGGNNCSLILEAVDN